MTTAIPFDAFEAAALDFRDLVSRIDASRLDGPGLGSWSLRTLIGHTSRALATVRSYVDVPAAEASLHSPAAYIAAASQAVGATSGEAIEQRARDAGTALGDNPAAAVRELVDQTLTRLHAQDDVLISTIAGGMWLSAYLPTRTFELVVHALDIATGSDLGFDPSPLALRAALDVAAEAAAAGGTGRDVLLALTGRATLPPGYSVV